MTRIKQLWNKLKPKTKADDSEYWAIFFSVLLIATGVKALVTQDVIDWIIVAVMATVACTKWVHASVQRNLEVFLTLEEDKIKVYEQDRLRQDVSQDMLLNILGTISELGRRVDDGNTGIQVRLSHLEKLAEKDGS